MTREDMENLAAYLFYECIFLRHFIDELEAADLTETVKDLEEARKRVKSVYRVLIDTQDTDND